MTKTCCAPGCNGHNQPKNTKVFSFPKDPKRRKAWIDQMGMDKDWAPKNHWGLCQAHFEHSQLESKRQDGLVKLRWNAVPTVFQDPLAANLKRRKPPAAPEKRADAEPSSKLPSVPILNHKRSMDDEKAGPDGRTPAVVDSVPVQHAKRPAREASAGASSAPNVCNGSRVVVKQESAPGNDSGDDGVELKPVRRICVARGCTTPYGYGIEHFKLPADEQRRRVWAENIDNPKRTSARVALLCVTHFCNDQLETNRQDGQLKLRWNAVPTLFKSHSRVKHERPRMPAQLPVLTWTSDTKEEDRVTSVDLSSVPHKCRSNVALAVRYKWRAEVLERRQKQLSVPCSADGCQSTEAAGFEMFEFPAQPDRRRDWLGRLGRPPGWAPGEEDRLCEVHFFPDQFKQQLKSGAKRLVPNAVPTLFNRAT